MTQWWRTSAQWWTIPNPIADLFLPLKRFSTKLRLFPQVRGGLIELLLVPEGRQSTTFSLSPPLTNTEKMGQRAIRAAAAYEDGHRPCGVEHGK